MWRTPSWQGKYSWAKLIWLSPLLCVVNEYFSPFLGLSVNFSCISIYLFISSFLSFSMYLDTDSRCKIFSAFCFNYLFLSRSILLFCETARAVWTETSFSTTSPPSFPPCAWCLGAIITSTFITHQSWHQPWSFCRGVSSWIGCIFTLFNWKKC